MQGKYQDAFASKYKIGASELIELISTKHYGQVKSRGLSRLIKEEVKERGVEADNEFFKALIEAVAEGNIKLPENQKLDVDFVLFEIPNVEASIPKSKGVLEDFKEIVSSDDLRPATMGVYVSKDGFLVGTDAWILVKYENKEFIKDEGKIIDLKKYITTKGKAFDFIDAKYPNYDAVIPNDNEYKFKGLSTYSFYNFTKSCINVKKQTTIYNFNAHIKINNEIYTLNPILLGNLLNFALCKGFDSFDFEISDSKSRALILKFGGKNIGLIMPVYGNNAENGAVPYTIEEIQESYGMSKSSPKKKPSVTKPIVTKPTSTEEYRKFEGTIDESQYIPRREIASVTLRSGEVLSGNDIIDGIYRAKKKFAEGGEVSYYSKTKKGVNFLFEEGDKGKVRQILSNGKFGMHDATILEKYAAEQNDGSFYPFYYVQLKGLNNKSLYAQDELIDTFAKGGEVDRISVGDNVYAYFAHNYVGYQLVESPSMGEPYDGKVIDIINENNQKKYVVKFENGETKKLSQGIFDDYVIKEKFAKGGKIGFEGLANKVAKRYVRKKVAKKYQAEYGKTYDAKEAKEVGNKVAGKVYKQQVAKKKIVRKLQRKTK